MPKPPESPRRFTCACVQFNVKRDDVEGNLAQAETGLRAAVESGARLAILPELWTTSLVKDVTDGLLAASSAAEATVQAMAQRHSLVIVSTAIERHDGKLFNRATVIDQGTVRGTYRKIHLFSPNGENRLLSPGDRPLAIDTSVGRVGVVICYDLRFPELVRWHMTRNVELLAVPAQWPEARSEHWRTLLRARAIENEMFVAGCNRTGSEASIKTDDQLHFPGDSRIFDPMGEAVGSGAGEDGPVCGEIELRKVKTMRRILPIRRDRRPDVYERLWARTWKHQDDKR